MRKIIYVCMIFLCGCASSVQSHLDSVQNNFAHGDFAVSSDTTTEDKSNLDLLIDGVALFHQNDFKASDETFEEFNKRNINETSSSFSREATGLLIGQGANSYKPYMMDSLFVSYYQIWDLLAMGDFSNARVVINQSYIRQQNMSREYKELIEENKKQISKKAEYRELLDKNTNDWLAFNDIMNPALMYLSGIYFLNAGDFDNATTYLKRANGMVPNNTFIKQDLEYAQKRIKPTNTTWQFIESGFAPRLREQNFGFFAPHVGMVYFTYSQAYKNENFFSPKNAELLANVDAMFMTEYNEYSTNEILRSYTSAVSKALLQASLYNSHNNSASVVGGILSSVYSVASSNSDVRTWAVLPKYIYVNRIDRNKTNLKELNLDVNIKQDIQNDGNNLIYMRYNSNLTDTKIIQLQRSTK